MTAENNFWSELSTYETLRQRKSESLSEIDFRVEKANTCLRKCQESIAELDDYLKRSNLPYVDQERAELQDSMVVALEHAEDFTKYWRNNLVGDAAELNLMEKLIDSKIDSRYSGKTTAIDVFAKVEEKIVLIRLNRQVVIDG